MPWSIPSRRRPVRWPSRSPRSSDTSRPSLPGTKNSGCATASASRERQQKTRPRVSTRKDGSPRGTTSLRRTVSRFAALHRALTGAPGQASMEGSLHLDLPPRGRLQRPASRPGLSIGDPVPCRPQRRLLLPVVGVSFHPILTPAPRFCQPAVRVRDVRYTWCSPREAR